MCFHKNCYIMYCTMYYTSMYILGVHRISILKDKLEKFTKYNREVINHWVFFRHIINVY